MSMVGAELPPHLQTKRKRIDNDDGSRSSSPASPKRARSSSSNEDSKHRRVIGPTAPPAPLSERPTTPPTRDDESSDSSSDDDFGPSLPPAPGSTKQTLENQRQQDMRAEALANSISQKPQREEWMLVPPKQDDWTARVDPTKLRNRKFQTGKSSKAPPSKSSDENALWTETPEQKRQRLQDEVLGVKKPAQLGPPEDERDAAKEAEARETRKRIQEYDERHRGESLYEGHKKVEKKEKVDDPSKRAFDREKDMGLGIKVGEKQRREMLTRAKGFGDRFAGGSFL